MRKHVLVNFSPQQTVISRATAKKGYRALGAPGGAITGQFQARQVDGTG